MGKDAPQAAAPSSTSITQTSIPDYAKPYVETMLGKAQALQDQPYQAYGGQRIAGFSPMQQQAFGRTANQQVAGQLAPASQLAGMAGLGSLATRYGPTSFQSQYNAPGAYQTGEFGTQSFAQPGSAEAYMSPYMQNVVDIQQREAQRSADVAGTKLKSQAAQMGAFGGSRQGVLEAEAARNLATQKGDIQATGSQAAFQQAQAQFNAEQQRRQQAQQALEQSRQYGAGMGMTAAQQAAQYGAAAQQAAEQSKQFGATLGLQGLSQAGQMAGTLGQLGAQQFGQEQAITGGMQAAGSQQQQLQQAQLQQQYQDFLTQRGYPQQQLSYMSDMLRGLPMSQSTQQQYTAPPSPFSQLAGAATTAYGLSRKEGGVIKMAKGGLVERPAGLAELVLHRMS